MGDEVGNERTCADDHHRKEDAEMLWLQCDEKNDDQVERDEEMVDHPGADAVQTALPHIVSDAHHGNHQHEDEGYQLRLGQARVVQYLMEAGDARKMGDHPVHLTQIGGDSHREPVGRDDSHQRGPEHLAAESHQGECHHQPQERHEEHNLDKYEAGNAQTEEGVIGESRRSLVLIGVEDDRAEHDDA